MSHVRFCLLLLLLLPACQSRVEPTISECQQQARDRFLKMVQKREIGDRLGVEDLPRECFVAGSKAAEYEAILRTATRKTTRPFEGRGEVDAYEWELDDHVDGLSLYVLVDGKPPRILGTETVTWLK